MADVEKELQGARAKRMAMGGVTIPKPAVEAQLAARAALAGAPMPNMQYERPKKRVGTVASVWTFVVWFCGSIVITFRR